MSEQFKCPRRSEGPTLPGYPEFDQWNLAGKDRCCSFCGSMHPEDFTAFLKEVLKDEQDFRTHVGVTDKKYKLYVRRPEPSDPRERAIKFYMQHAPASPTNPKHFDSEFILLLNSAIQVSLDKEDALLKSLGL